MLRKIASVVLLIIGGLFVSASSSALMVMFKHEEIGAIGGLILLIFAGLATPFMVGGVGLWGWRRWRIVLGVVLTVVGGMFATYAISIPLVMLSPEWELAGGLDVSEMMKPFLKSFALFGVPLLAIGIFLILRQKKRDKRLTA